MKQSIKTLAVVFSVTLNLAFMAGYGFRKFNDRSKFAYEELDLSKKQRQHVQDARDRLLHTLNEIGNAIANRQIEILNLIAADSVDSRAIETKFEEVQALQKSMHRQVVKHLLEDKDIFTPAQRAKFFAVLRSRVQEQNVPGPPWLPGSARKKKQQ